MTKQSTQLVEFRDTKTSQALLFGPFVSIGISETFFKALPEPLQGGFKRYRTLQRFTHDETKMVTDLILISRQLHKHSEIHREKARYIHNQ